MTNRSLLEGGFRYLNMGPGEKTSPPPGHSVSRRDAIGLKRSLGFWLVAFYGLGTIVGAGIYVLVGSVAAASGMAAPLAFLLAGVLAALTGLAYAELASRLPEAAGAVAYVHHAFRSSTLAHIVAVLVAVVALMAGASIARGSSGYVRTFFDIPDWLPAAAMVILFTGIACARLKIGGMLAAGVGALEIIVLIAAAATGLDSLGTLPLRVGEIVPRGESAWLGLAQGAFLAFFAYIGFENLSSLGEETKNADRTLPRAIVFAIGLATLIYCLVALVAVLTVPMDRLAGSTAPLCLLLERREISCGHGFALLALAALSNGVFAEIILVSRLVYGMARRELLPAVLGKVSAAGVPLRATLLVGLLTLVLVVTLPFSALAGVTSAITLVIFSFVNAALIRLKMRDRRNGSVSPRFQIPVIIPVMGCALSLVLLALSLVG
jgi:basic amino acid/polyamine antiporter, APA family